MRNVTAGDFGSSGRHESPKKACKIAGLHIFSLDPPTTALSICDPRRSEEAEIESVDQIQFNNDSVT